VTVSAAPTGLVAAYGFNEPSGNALDSSGNSNTGTVSGATRSASGRYGGALSFDGTNDRVNVTDSASLDLTTGMTLEAWVRPTALSIWRTVILKEQPGSLVYALYANTDINRPSIEASMPGAYNIQTGTSQLPLNTWTHLAATYDGATLRLYVNGVQVGSRGVTGNVLVSTGALRIGGNAVWGEYFSGLIDEVRIYNRALTQTEIQNDMNTPVQ
jgi:hypothetical protein